MLADTPIVNPILNGLINSALKRGDQWLNIHVKKFPQVEKIGEMVMMGAHSFALVQTRRRLVKEKIVLDRPSEVYETPSAIARDYLRQVYKRGPRATRAQLERTGGIPPVPAYASPRAFAHGYYIDIKSAYWSIMEIIGWNVDYNPGLWLSPGRPPLDFPFPDHKVARNCLVSAGRMGGIPIYDPRKDEPYYTVTRGSELRNNLLPRLIHDVLNSIAIDAIKAGAIYANNDGFIVPDEKSLNAVRGIITDWGLVGRIKAEGGGRVKASGTYTIGKTKTLNYESVANPLPIENIFPPPYRRWLQREFSFFAANIQEL